MPNLTLIFNDFEEVHLGKDVFLMPYHLGRELGCDVTIVFPRTDTNRGLPDTYRGVRLVAIERNRPNRLIRVGAGTWSAMPFYSYLARHARRIDVLMLFHAREHTLQMAWLYRRLNRRGRLYVKLDGTYAALERPLPTGSWLSRLKWSIYTRFNRTVDCVSIETSESYNQLRRSPLPQLQFGDRLLMVPNGFDEEALRQSGIEVKPQSRKERLMITVGRLGTRQKNTQMLLQALDGVDLGDWRVVCIGPVEDSLTSDIEAYYRRNPHNRDRLTFVGNISDKAMLWDYYNRARVSILTSRWESYGLVLNEGRRFGNYLLSTPVGAAADLITQGVNGAIVDIDDADALRRHITDIIAGRVDMGACDDIDPDSMSWAHMASIIAQRLK